MVDLTPRPDRYRDRAPDLDSVNGLIQARIDGVISRRELIRRAAAMASRRAGRRRDAARHLGHGLWRAVVGPRQTLRRLAQDGRTVPADAPTAPEGEAKTGGT